MKSLISFFILLLIKLLSNIFYRFKVGWPEKEIMWGEVKLIVLLNHTSLFEPLFLGLVPVSFLRRLSKRMIGPGADKTLNRPIVGTLLKLFSPGLVTITRKRDDSWEYFLSSIYEDAVILIVPEGRMKRRTGLDLEGKKMNVRSGVVDILAGLHKGQMLLAYSGGLHHVQAPGEGFPRLFKTLSINLDVFEIADYKTRFPQPTGSDEWKKSVLEDLQHRLETKVSDAEE